MACCRQLTLLQDLSESSFNKLMSVRKAIIRPMLLAVLVAGATAQTWRTGTSAPEQSAPEQQDACGGKHTTAEHLTCYVTFDGASDLPRIEVEFNLQAQGGGNCVLRESRKIDDRTYAVSGSLSTCPSGAYTLASVIASRGKAYRQYQAGFGLSSQIALEIEQPVLEQKPEQSPSALLDHRRFRHKSVSPPKVNPCAPDLPEIKTIRPAPPASTVGRVTMWFRRSTNRCGGKHAPGDRLACHLQFSKATDLSGLTVGFEMDDRDRSVPYYQRPKDQQGLCTSFVFYEDYKKIDSRTYEITGLLPACGSARYFLSEVTAFRAGDADLNCPSRNYTSPADIKKPVTFRLENSNQTLLPDLIGVSGDH
jgi:hypothetical protein